MVTVNFSKGALDTAKQMRSEMLTEANAALGGKTAEAEAAYNEATTAVNTLAMSKMAEYGDQFMLVMADSEVIAALKAQEASKKAVDAVSVKASEVDKDTAIAILNGLSGIFESDFNLRITRKDGTFSIGTSNAGGKASDPTEVHIGESAKSYDKLNGAVQEIWDAMPEVRAAYNDDRSAAADGKNTTSAGNETFVNKWALGNKTSRFWATVCLVTGQNVTVKQGSKTLNYYQHENGEVICVNDGEANSRNFPVADLR